ncbi:hypothetical protein LCGC14_2652200, partial [marine sediment metagenome]
RAAAVSAEMKAFRLEQFQRWVNRYHLQGKTVIEIGAGAGEYLSLLTQADINAVGLEHNADSVLKAKQAGLQIEQGFLENDNQEINNGPFDAFVMLNFLEHLPDPNSSLRAIHNNLREGAIGLVEVPNFDMILRQKLFSEFISDHLFYFTKDTFIRTLEFNGFDVLECEETWHDYSLSASVKKRVTADLSVFQNQQIKLKTILHDYIDSHIRKGVAVWGAGHQALAVMALAELGNKIRYVVDSAAFKQSCYTPATHIPIVPPSELIDNPVAAVIVMAASYSDEVVRILCESYNGINIAVLRDDTLEIVRELTA